MTTISVLALTGSLRRASTNKGLIRCAMRLAPAGMSIATADLADVPFYNADVAAEGIPAPVQEIFSAMKQADALLFACPEYNYSLAPALKNILDWASREPGNALLDGKPAAIMGAGGGMGTCRAQYHLRQVCVYLNLHLLNKPELFANAFTPDFNDSGDVVSEALEKRILTFLEAFHTHCKYWVCKA